MTDRASPSAARPHRQPDERSDTAAPPSAPDGRRQPYAAPTVAVIRSVGRDGRRSP